MTTLAAPSDTEMYTPQQVARILQVDTKTLANWRYLGRGPGFMKDGGVVRYSRDALTAYLTSRTVTTHA
ncbi:MAG: helix-turn-helix domain-containing protein [Brachybacterium sp.]|uniref:helix-turn-helix domain-containing protein n=1 Tax=Brachybacterium sp. TaxID=1891286 RepID=UPI00264A1B86|nr:helix-turn-helix domain-containing protein [Brachybacterium sp.]MDN5687081.1 helix-turn-helix domain-containing protein [Brachybacterium sp.]